ncbi:MAG: hypothetical protein ACOYVJ_03240 [Nitrospirota bacterium]
MKALRENIIAKLLALIAVSVFIIPINATVAFAGTTTKIKHEPAQYFVPGYRIILSAEVKDKKGINLVRCYFKTPQQADYVFVAMESVGSRFKAILPAPNITTEAIDYLFLVVNGKNEVVRTSVFTIKGLKIDKVPAWQSIGSEGTITVSSELTEAQTVLPGFTDSITMDFVESAARFGYVAGLYNTAKMAEAGGASGIAQAASYAGGVALSTGGIGTLGWIGLGALVVGGGAAGAAALSGGGGGGDDDGGGGGTVVQQCSQVNLPGGDTPETRTINLGKKSGTFRFDYDTQNQEDRMRVIYQGSTLFDSGCVGTKGTRTQWISYSGSSSQITVSVEPNCYGGTGTAWEFTVFCP